MLQMDGAAPYAPVKAVVSVIERHRQVGLPAITTDTLVRMGVTQSLAPRTVQALKLLDLIDDAGKPTDEFEAIRKAPMGDLPSALANLIRDVYAPVFSVVDPTTASVTEIEDAFRGFAPSGQRARMVTLFTGLMAYAKMIAAAPKQAPGPRPKAAGTTRASVRKPKTPITSTTAPSADPVTPPQAPTDDMRRMYFDLLLEKAKTEGATDTDLLDRIERLIGLETSLRTPAAASVSNEGGAS